jgi:hypothetical protein
MGTYMFLTTKVKKEHYEEFRKIVDDDPHIPNVLDEYDFNSEVFVIFKMDYFGYAEPTDGIYPKIKHLVKDMWYCLIEESDVKVGQNTTQIWYSCKDELNRWECSDEAYFSKDDVQQNCVDKETVLKILNEAELDYGINLDCLKKRLC